MRLARKFRDSRARLVCSWHDPQLTDSSHHSARQVPLNWGSAAVSRAACQNLSPGAHFTPTGIKEKQGRQMSVSCGELPEVRCKTMTSNERFLWHSPLFSILSPQSEQEVFNLLHDSKWSPQIVNQMGVFRVTRHKKQVVLCETGLKASVGSIGKVICFSHQLLSRLSCLSSSLAIPTHTFDDVT